MVLASVFCLTRSIGFEQVIYCRHGGLGLFQVRNSLHQNEPFGSALYYENLTQYVKLVNNEKQRNSTF